MFFRKLLSNNVPCIHRTLKYSSFHSPLSLEAVQSSVILNRSRSSIILSSTSLVPSNVFNKRFKSEKKSRKEKSSDSDDEEEWKDDDNTLSRDSKVLSMKLSSMRADAILKAGLKISRNKIEVLFYESKLRINGKPLLKKSANIKIGDEIDVVKSLSPHNEDHLYISRLEVLDAAVKDDIIVVTGRRFKTLLIENYDDPWKPTSKMDLS